MMKTAILAALLGSAAAFAPAQNPGKSFERNGSDLLSYSVRYL